MELMKLNNINWRQQIWSKVNILHTIIYINRKVENVLSILVWMFKFSLNDAIEYDSWTKARLAATIPTEVWRTPISFLQFILFNWIYFIKVLRIHNLIFNSAIIFYFDLLSKYFKYKFELIFQA